MELKRVVVTGLGAVTPLGNDVKTTWENMIAGVSGAGEITRFDCSLFKTHFACEVKDFDISSLLDRKEQRKVDRFVHFALAAAKEALDDAAFPENEDKDNIGVIWGSGMGGLDNFQDQIIDFAKGDGTPRFSPFFIPKAICDMAAGYVSIFFGLRGPNYATTAACASSAIAISNACDLIRLGKATAIVAGGSEAAVDISGIGGFNSLHAISTRNDSPATASRPFSASRDGFVLGEGGACLILEEYEHAKARGAHIYAELAGTALTADAHHITAPDPEGKGAILVMKRALEDAGISADQIDYINTHGTSTGLGDIAEVKAIQEVFGEAAYKLNINSTKSMTGHLLGGAGAVEAMAVVMSLKDQIVPPTINHDPEDNDPELDYNLNFTFNQAQKRSIRYALSNTFGFGGHNACLIFKQFTE